MEAQAKLSRWTLLLCLTSTIIYTILLTLFPLLLLANPSAMLLLFPLSVPICLSLLWFSYGRDHYSRARLYSFIPAFTLLLSTFLP